MYTETGFRCDPLITRYNGDLSTTASKIKDYTKDNPSKPKVKSHLEYQVTFQGSKRAKPLTEVAELAFSLDSVAIRQTPLSKRRDGVGTFGLPPASPGCPETGTMSDTCTPSDAKTRTWRVRNSNTLRVAIPRIIGEGASYVAEYSRAQDSNLDPCGTRFPTLRSPRLEVVSCSNLRSLRHEIRTS